MAAANTSAAGTAADTTVSPAAQQHSSRRYTLPTAFTAIATLMSLACAPASLRCHSLVYRTSYIHIIQLDPTLSPSTSHLLRMKLIGTAALVSIDSTPCPLSAVSGVHRLRESTGTTAPRRHRARSIVPRNDTQLASLSCTTALQTQPSNTQRSSPLSSVTHPRSVRHLYHTNRPHRAAMPSPFPATTAYSSSTERGHPRHRPVLPVHVHLSIRRWSRTTASQSGKYTIGLGQLGLSYVTDREDVYSIALSAVESLHGPSTALRYEDIGRLEVGSETILDHSKSIKSVLMQLFAASGNSGCGGRRQHQRLLCRHPCAVQFSVDWIESSAFDGRYALVVAADIAEYASGPARPTGGCGAVVMLLGPDAPLVLDRGVRASHMEHAWDFYKPNMDSPYPLVDGKFSNSCYIRALDTCYQRYVSKYRAQVWARR